MPREKNPQLYLNLNNKQPPKLHAKNLAESHVCHAYSSIATNKVLPELQAFIFWRTQIKLLKSKTVRPKYFQIPQIICTIFQLSRHFHNVPTNSFFLKHENITLYAITLWHTYKHTYIPLHITTLPLNSRILNMPNLANHMI